MSRFTNESKFADVHLQWFAAEDEGRTEEPTEHKIKKAREEGKVAKSNEFTSALVLLFPIVALGILAPFIFRTLKEMITFFFNSSTEIDITREGQVTRAFLNYFIRITLPIAAVAFVSAILGNIFQVGFLFSVKPIKPDLKKIMPKFGKFFKKALFSGEAFFNLGKSIVKIIMIGAIAFVNIRMEVDKFAHFMELPLLLAFSTVVRVAFRILVESAIAMLVLSLPDYLFQRRQFRESLKMTKHEVKEERKMHEGDPLVQSRLRERMREIMNRNMLQNVPKADVVVTNPTHFAVAMEYDQVMMNAPTVTAKGQDNMAMRIREIAGDNGVPIIENKPLARALYAEVEIGDAIPEQYYEVMAHILAQVYRMQNGGEEAV
jgi:flagellar biosynthetic protein FlhB